MADPATPGGGWGLSKRRGAASNQIGLDVGLILSRFFLKSSELHFGCWPDDLAIEPWNLRDAQARHSELMAAQIPRGTRRVLDVGGGSGSFARKLRDRGLEVDYCAPSPLLCASARKLLGHDSRIFECRFEDLETTRRYDLVQFSESFQYVDLQAGLHKALELLAGPGCLLICDFFRRDGEGRAAVRGGHLLGDFEAEIARAPLELVYESDITRETARTLTLVDDALREVAVPIRELTSDLLGEHHPLVARLLGWLFAKRIAKLDRRFLSGRITAEAFEKSHAYRLLLYEKTGPLA